MARTRRTLGGACVATGTIAWLVWLIGRAASPSANVLWLVVLATEIVGVLTGVLVAVLLASGTADATAAAPDPADGRADRAGTDWFPTAVARLLGVDVGSDPRAAVRGSWRVAVTAASPLRERTLALVRFEGVRRLVAIAAVATGLLIGVPPFAEPQSMWLVGVAALGLVASSVGTMVLSGGWIRPGDRLRWSFGAIGLAVGPRERADSMPVRWVGVMGSIVILNLAIALRGLSDRWTHGLPPMADADRVTAMSTALALLAGAVVTLHHLQPPAAAYYRATRRLEERSARQTALGATAVAALIGFVAGILPGSVDAADRQPVDREGRPQVQRVVEVDPHPTEVGHRPVGATEVPDQNPDEP